MCDGVEGMDASTQMSVNDRNKFNLSVRDDGANGNSVPIPVGNSEGRSLKPSSERQPFGRSSLDSADSSSVDSRTTEEREVKEQGKTT
ncbi:hypothetical protein OUZ56_012491 [Daphnia magna]|uniref:Uncharacterized protein n=1 Tax=Daphnia magna TaxID=35525 RepID=A0ABQ9Z393_9CRUS|nr:hypothetical protein OUZ56_012491 [Daphnia magna]